MIEFDEIKQDRRFAQLREQEEENVMQILSQKYNIPYVDLTGLPINTDALSLILEATALSSNIAAFNRVGKEVEVAVHSPQNDLTLAALKELKERGYEPKLYLASKKSLAVAWERYKDVSLASESKRGLLDVSSEEILKFLSEVHSIEDIRTYIEQTLFLKKTYRISRIMEVLLASALATRSSDIHIEPEEKQVRLRMRLDGILTDITAFDHETFRLLISRIKLLSGLKLNVQKEAQDGRFSIHIGESDIEIRTSTLPGQYGESVVMRILNPDAISVSVEALGMRPELLQVVLQEIKRPNGMILTTGPTGSGKTTTLYAFLKKVHSPGVKIITIEDPIEYHLTGIVQTQVDTDKEYTFSSGLRAAMRQDPDIIMVGEIRDSETAEIATHAALTGHLVFSTLHTNSAAGAFTRLIDIGINPRILGSAINLALAQRLIRQLCGACKKEVPLQGKEKELIEKVLSTVIDLQKIDGLQREKMWVAGEGCSECGGIGYKGRIGIYEGVVMDEKVEELVQMVPSERELKKVAAPQGILTMAQDSALKILEGVTTLEEVLRVIDLTE